MKEFVNYLLFNCVVFTLIVGVYFLYIVVGRVFGLLGY